MTRQREAADTIDYELRHWRQGDLSLDVGLEFVHVFEQSRPLSPASVEAIRA